MEADERAAGPASSGKLAPPWESRGTDLSRMLALSDGIFAFAMTLLVLGLALPTGFDPHRVVPVLVGLRSAFLAYLLSFFTIWLYWRAHHRLFGYVRSFDRLLLDLNVVFLLFVAVLPFATNLLAAASEARAAVWTYAVVQAGAGSSLVVVWAYASRGQRHVVADLPPEWSRYLVRVTLVAPVVFAASIPIAYWDPGAAEYAWLALFFAGPLVRWRTRTAGAAP